MLKREKVRAPNRRLAKKRVQCLIEALCFVSSALLADSFVLLNPLLRQAPERAVCLEILAPGSNQLNIPTQDIGTKHSAADPGFIHPANVEISAF